MPDLPVRSYANLHLHSTHSDGVYTPAQLAQIAYDEGYRAMALTDHDTVTGNPEAKEACEKLGMGFLFGAEFTVAKPDRYHIVGLEFDPTYPPMADYLAQMGERETHQTREIFSMAVQNGGITGITWEEVLEYNKGIVWLCNNHVFRAMQAKGLVKESDYMDFFRRNYQTQRSLIPPLRPFKTTREIIDLIHQAGGLVIYAHPTRPWGTAEDIYRLANMGVDGVEVRHPDVPEEEQPQVRKIAEELGLYVSGGSDHSGLCGGYYASFPTEEELKASHFYITPCAAGASEAEFNALRLRKRPAPADKDKSDA